MENYSNLPSEIQTAMQFKGYLKKKSSGAISQMQKRWFYMGQTEKGICLMYKDNEKDKAPKEEIELDKILDITYNQERLITLINSIRIYELQAKTSGEAQEWINHFNEIRKYIKQTQLRRIDRGQTIQAENVQKYLKENSETTTQKSSQKDTIASSYNNSQIKEENDENDDVKLQELYKEREKRRYTQQVGQSNSNNEVLYKKNDLQLYDNNKQQDIKIQNESQTQKQTSKQYIQNLTQNNEIKENHESPYQNSLNNSPVLINKSKIEKINKDDEYQKLEQKIKQLNSDLQITQLTINNLQNEKQELKIQLDKQDQELNQIGDDYIKADNENDKLKKELKQYKEQNQKSEEQNKLLEQLHQEKAKLILTREQEIQILQGQLLKQQPQNKDSQQNTYFEEKLKEQDQQIKEYDKLLKEKDKQVQNQIILLEKQHLQVEQDKVQISQLQKKEELKNIEMSKLQEQIQQFKQQILHCQQEIQQKSEECNQLQNKQIQQQQSSQNQENQNEILILTDKIRAITFDIEYANKEAVEAKMQVASLAWEKESFKEQVIKLKKELQQVYKVEKKIVQF